jgi:hypothetical protein
MALTLGTLEMCAHALGTFMPSYIGKSARFFFMLEACRTCGYARDHLSWEVRSRDVGHVVALKPTSAKR